MARFPRKIPRNTRGGNFEKSFIARDIVPTLYELLGALPQDDADGLRAAFRKAAKTSHPDNNPGDPEAPQRFRQIVRAHAILADEQQRATYDSLLAEAEQERTPDARRNGVFGVSLPGPIGSMVIASISIGAFVALERVLTAPVVSAQVQELSARATALTAAMPMQTSGTVGLASERNRPAEILSTKEPEIPSAHEVTAPAVVATTESATTDSDGPAPAMREPAVKDAKYYLAQGDLAYRSGDFVLALTDFDLAINLDPNSSDAYVNRAIVFRRMGDLKRAFADVNAARRIDQGKHQ